MLVFPQTSTGSVAQYPIRKRRLVRTVVNESPGGQRYKLSDGGAGMLEWRLPFVELTDAEKDALVLLFGTVEARLSEFTFLDPTDNLLCWSEKLDETIWQRNSLLQAVGGHGDPLATLRATRLTNTGGATLRVEQTINAPGWFQYALSVWARSDQPEQLSLVRATTLSTQLETHDVGPVWKRCVLSGKFEGTEETVRFGLEVEAGRSVVVFGLQAEAQAGASLYKKTLSRCGVYPQARFGEDELRVTAEGPGRHSCALRVVVRTQG